MSNDKQENHGNQDDHPKGRSWDQITKGTTSAATMGAGATGDVAATAEDKEALQNVQGVQGGDQQGQPGGQSLAGRTDDLLAGGSNDEQDDEGFQGKAGSQGSHGSQAAAAGPSDRQAGAPGSTGRDTD